LVLAARKSRAKEKQSHQVRSAPLFLARPSRSARYDDRGGLTRAYCTVRLIVVICVTVSAVLVTTMEAGAGFVWLVVLLELPHPVEASSVPAISKVANSPRSSEQRRPICLSYYGQLTKPGTRCCQAEVNK
jgi:hypothetical protein